MLTVNNMRQYGNKTIADVGKYLIASDGRRGFALANKEDVTFDEYELETSVEIRPYNSVCIGRVFQVKVTEDLKRDLVNLIFSNDNQIAIILNKDDSEEDKAMYDFMQLWREWFGSLTKKIKEVING